jgi:opacity protein-like surface antigen
MNDKKHIDRLFQEKFKDFEAHPSGAVWDAIEKDLRKDKRKRRVIPLWWQIAGVAAGIALLFTIGNLIFNDVPTAKTISNSVVNGNNVESLEESTNQQSISISNDVPEKNQKTDVETPTNSNSKLITNSNAQKTSSIVVSNKTSNNSLNSDTSKESVSQVKSLAKDNSTKVFVSKNKSTINSSNLPEFNFIPIDVTKNNANSIATNDPLKENIIQSIEENTHKEEVSLEDIVAAIQDQNEKVKEEERLSRWNISTNVAPVYFNSLGQGSSLDEQFIDNSKEGEINMSYGLKGSYAVTNKLKIRAGINKVDLGYSINNVVVYNGFGTTVNSLQPRNSGHINFSNKTQNTTVLSSQSLNSSAIPEIISTNVNGSLNQELGFIEIPFELEYNLIDKKIGFNVIGGFSTLFLNKNNIYTDLEGNRTLLGEANNIRNTSYSANFGLGLNYNVSDKIKVNLEPTFKYQINTFQDTSGNFRPFFIGVYTGLSYKF